MNNERESVMVRSGHLYLPALSDIYKLIDTKKDSVMHYKLKSIMPIPT